MKPTLRACQNLFEHLPAGAELLTPNQRLSRFLQQRYAELARLQGRRAWAALPAQSLALWVQQQWQRWRFSGLAAGQSSALGNLEETLLWQAMVRDSAVADTLFNPSAAAQTAQKAWATLGQWGLRGSRLPGLNEHFSAWAQGVQQQCDARGWRDASAQLEDLCGAFASGELRVPAALVLLSFDGFSPQQEALFKVLISQGCQVEKRDLVLPESETLRVAAADAEEELRFAARWAASCVTADPSARVAVVIPDLGARRAAVEQVFMQVFEPLHPLPEQARRATPFNISASVPLASVPPVAAALALLKLSRHSLACAEVEALLHSPFWGAAGELPDRAQLAAALRGEHLQLNPAQLRRYVGEWHPQAGEGGRDEAIDPSALPLADLHQRLHRAQQLQLGWPAEQAPSVWRVAVEHYLSCLGWPGERSPDSLEYQQLGVWQNLLESFASLDELLPNLSLTRAVEVLGTMARETPFQAQSPDSPVQVLGLLEASGMLFDALWVMGLHDEAWPPPVKPNPLLPLALQRQQRMPQGSVEKELALAQGMTRRFAGAAARVIFSHPRLDGEKRLAPSALIAGFPLREATELVAESAPTPAQILFASSALEVFDDAVAGEVRAPESLRGGARILQDQSACPFKAFATHRLAARAEEEASLGFSAAERGLLVHRVLELVWRRLGDQAQLLAMPEPQLQAMVGDAARSATLPLARARGISATLAMLEQQRLQALVLAWLALERARPPFSVVTSEEAQQLSLAGLPLRLRFDRVDRLEDGRYLILDYKTSRKGIAAWHGERPDEPQVPLYSLARPQGLAAVAFGQLSISGVKLEGLGETADLAPGIRAMSDVSAARYPHFAGDFAGQLRQWREVLEALAAQFMAGDARVMPKTANTCRYCHLQSLCRIHSRGAWGDTAELEDPEEAGEGEP